MKSLKTLETVIEGVVLFQLLLIEWNVLTKKGNPRVRRDFFVFLLFFFISLVSFFIRDSLGLKIGESLSFFSLLTFPAAFFLFFDFFDDYILPYRKFYFLIQLPFILLVGVAGFIFKFPIHFHIRTIFLFLFAVEMPLFLFLSLSLFLSGSKIKKGFLLYLSMFVLFLLIEFLMLRWGDFLYTFHLFLGIFLYLYFFFLILLRYRYMDYIYPLIFFLSFSALFYISFPALYFLQRFFGKIFYSQEIFMGLMLPVLFFGFYFLFRFVFNLFLKLLNLKNEEKQASLFRFLTDKLSIISTNCEDFNQTVLSVLSEGTETRSLVFYRLEQEQFLPVAKFGEFSQEFPFVSKEDILKFFLTHSGDNFWIAEKEEGEYFLKYWEAGSFISFCRFSEEVMAFVIFIENQNYLSYFDRIFISKVLREVSGYLYFEYQKSEFEAQEGFYQNIRGDLELTRLIQEKMLPENKVLNSFFKLYGLNRPAQQLSGGFYDYFIDRSGNLLFYIADVSGKNISAAMVMIFAKVVFYLILMKSEDLSYAMQEINQMIFREFSMGYFLTVFIGKIKPSLEMEYINAGHENPFLLRKGKEPLELSAKGCPIGVLERSDFEVKEISLKKKDVLFLYTDGLIDATDLSGDFFGRERIFQALAAIHLQGKDFDVVDVLDELIRNHTGNQEQFDDITLLSLGILKKRGKN